ncbi:MAG: hypothetical protein MUF34_35305 [Polyangiaceae bacterium]|jgi:hypothetical protein|nr:hypothetical protein [Polyangiaceae bacterium]
MTEAAKGTSQDVRASVEGRGRRALVLRLVFITAPAVALGGSCSAANRPVTPAIAPPLRPPREVAAEVTIEKLTLAWPLDDPTAELSDLAWVGDELFLLPQFPSRFGPRPDGVLFKVSRAAIEGWIDGARGEPLDVRPVEFEAGGAIDRIDGFQGFEAIAVEGERVFLTAESRSEGRMHAHLMIGDLDAAHGRMSVRPDSIVELPCPGTLNNISYEALTVYQGSVVSFYESNGRALVHAPAALVWDGSLRSFERRPMSPLEFRVTGATAPDAEGRFWVTNIFWPGEPALRADDDPLFAAYGRGATHARSRAVERLIELRVGPLGVERTETPPLQLALSSDGRTRNWEGVARLGERGFLLVADEHPTTILAFVPNVLGESRRTPD